MAKKLKAQALALPVPQSDSEAREAIREIGDINRDALRLTAEMNDKIAALQQRYGEAVAPLNARVTALTDGLQIFCEANRDRLTRGGKVKFSEHVAARVMLPGFDFPFLSSWLPPGAQHNISAGGRVS